MKKDNTITVFYDEVTRKDIYRLNGIDVTDTIEMLKDKWERQILDTRCRLFQLDMTVQQRLQDQITDLQAKLAEKENDHIKDKIYLLEFLKANFADCYIYGVMKTDNYDRVKYSKDVNDIIDREIRKLNGEW